MLIVERQAREKQFQVTGNAGSTQKSMVYYKRKEMKSSNNMRHGISPVSSKPNFIRCDGMVWSQKEEKKGITLYPEFKQLDRAHT